MPVSYLRAAAIAVISGTGCLACLPAQAQPPEQPPYKPGQRMGNFVGSDKTITDLLADGYDLKAVGAYDWYLQKKASLFSCRPGDYRRSYCMELKEEK